MVANCGRDIGSLGKSSEEEKYKMKRERFVDLYLKRNFGML